MQLVAERVRRFYVPDLLGCMAGCYPETAAAVVSTYTECIVIAPVSNATVRDWPIERYIKLIGMLMTRVECRSYWLVRAVKRAI